MMINILSTYLHPMAPKVCIWTRIYNNIKVFINLKSGTWRFRQFKQGHFDTINIQLHVCSSIVYEEAQHENVIQDLGLNHINVENA